MQKGCRISTTRQNVISLAWSRDPVEDLKSRNWRWLLLGRIRFRTDICSEEFQDSHLVRLLHLLYFKQFAALVIPSQYILTNKDEDSFVTYISNSQMFYSFSRMQFWNISVTFSKVIFNVIFYIFHWRAAVYFGQLNLIDFVCIYLQILAKQHIFLKRY